MFRKAAMVVYGYSKGSLSKAAEDVFSAWSKQVLAAEHAVEIPADPVAAIEGMLKHVKADSVELQHRASALRAKKLKGARHALG